MTKQLHPLDIISKKKKNEKISMLTAYDFTMAKLINETDTDIVLVGDSLGNTFSGYSTTLPVTMDHMIYHTQAVVRGINKALVIADMPFLSYQVSHEEAKLNAGRLLKEGGAQAVKIEVTGDMISTIKSVIDCGIPVMAHLGFTPQSLYQLGGYKVQGREKEQVKKIIETSKELEKIGCFAVLLEMVPSSLSETLSKTLNIPTIGIGAGPYCDGQVLVTHDILGITPNKAPKFSKKYANLNSNIIEAITKYDSEVKNNIFPSEEHSFK